MSSARTPRWAPAVLIATLLLAAVALLPASRLEIETDLTALFPAGEPAVDDYRRYVESFSGLEKIYVAIVRGEPGGDGEQLATAAEAFAEALSSSPDVERARWGIEGRDREFFTRWVAPQAPLLLGDGWQEAVARRLEPEALRRRAARIRAEMLTPLGGFQSRLAIHDPLGWSAELRGLEGAAAGTVIDEASGAFLSPAGDAALVIVTPTSAEIDPEAGRRLMAAIEAAEEAMRELVAADLEVIAAGGALYATADESALKGDLQRTLGTSALACAALLILSFEGLLLPSLVVTGIPIALIWTAGLLGLLRESLGAVAIGFAAVLVGLGIDYSIHVVSRFRQEAGRGRPPVEALAAAYRGAGPGIVAAAATTAAAFATLTLARLRPVAEVGLVVAIGIGCMLVSAAAVGTGLLWVRAPQRDRRLWAFLGTASSRLAAFGARRRTAVLIGTVLVTAVTGFGFSRLAIDPALDALRPVGHPVVTAERQLMDRFGLELDTTTVLVPGSDVGEALERSGKVEQTLREAVGPGLQLISPRHWVTAGEERRRRLAALAEVGIPRAVENFEVALIAKGLDPRAFAAGLEVARRIGRGEDPGLAPRSEWPEWLAELLREKPRGAVAALHLRLPLDRWQEGPPSEVVAALEVDAPGSAVASARRLGGALRRLAGRDLRTLGGVALGVIAFGVLLSFRGRWRPAMLALVPVTLGTLWTLGGWALAGRELDLVTLVVLPVLLGVGIDDGLHVVHASRRSSSAGLRSALDETGRPIALTTLTTCVGFGSLTLSSVPGLASAGLLLAIGVLACLLATLVVLPALGGWEA